MRIFINSRLVIGRNSILLVNWAISKFTSCAARYRVYLSVDRLPFRTVPSHCFAHLFIHILLETGVNVLDIAYFPEELFYKLKVLFSH